MSMGILRSAPPDHAPGRPRRGRLRKPAAALAVAGVLVGGLLGAPAAAEPVTAETRVGEYTNPAVHIVTTQYDAKVKLRQIDWSDEGYQLFFRAYRKFQAGQLSASSFWGYVFDRAQRDPSRYLKETGKTRTLKYSIQYVGSGFVATPDGYVVTARHVVTPDAAVKATFARAGAADFGKSEAAAFIKEWEDLDMSTGAMNSIRRTMTGFAAAKVKVDLGRPKVAVRLGVASASGSREGKNQPAEVVHRSNPDLGADVAVLRIRVEGGVELPTVSLSDTKPQQGEPVYINAFPAAATYLKDFSKASQLQPTLTKGMITAPKYTEGGIELLQTDANAMGGSSGGAALDPDGNVIGMLVAGAEDEQGPVGQNYLMPVDVIRAALAQSGAKLVPSQTSVVYNDALNDFHNEYYSRAKGKFEQVKLRFPGHAYVGRFIAESQAAIDAGKDKTPPPPPATQPGLQISPLVVGGSLAGLVIVGLGLVVVLLLVRRRPGPAAGPEQSGQWGGEPRPGGDGGGDRVQPVTTGAAPGADGPMAVPGVATSAGVGAVAMADGSAAPAGDADAAPGGFEPMAADSGEDEAPDSFPSWEPIDYVPSVPPAGPNQTS